MPKFNPVARRKARQCALQALYQWFYTQADLSAIAVEFAVDHDMEGVDSSYFSELLHGIPSHLNELDDTMRPYLDRSLQDLNPVELAILRIGVYELVHRKDIPYKVILNEAIELAKTFGATDSHKYINGVLDQVAKQCI